MELREGYKNTEVGVIPEDWEVKEFAEISYMKGRIGWQGLKQTEFTMNTDEPFLITGMNFKDGEIKWDEVYHVSEERYNIAKDIQLGIGDVLMTKDGTIGKILYVNSIPYPHKASLNSHLLVFRPFRKSYIPKYLYYNLQSPYFFNHIELSKSGSTFFGISQDAVGKYKIPIPPLPEQTAIATALSDADALINSLSTLIVKKRNIKQGAMQQLLKPKEGWEHKSLGEIGLISGAGVDKLINEDEVPVRLVNYMDVFKRDFIYSNELNHWVTAPQHKVIKCAVKQGDVFFTPSSEMRYDIAVSAVAMEDIPNAVYSYHLVRLRLSEDWDLNFRTYIFKTRYFLGQAEQVCEGSGKRYVITLPKFRSLKVYYPKTKEEQNEIATILSDMDTEIQALETKLEKYRKIKLGMMQNLLTGKIRLV